jgi:Cytochrome b5-like Heme/Steroid binding domain
MGYVCCHKVILDRSCSHVLTQDLCVAYPARAHPGGEAILQKFHNKDATLAFQKAHHSDAAVAMLQDFAIADNLDTVLDKNRGDPAMTSSQVHDSGRPQTAVRSALSVKTGKPRWRVKLFTKEDPFGVHKYLGVFVLLHFAFRFYQMLFTDPSAGLGTRLGRGPSWIALACLLPHGLLSLSSLIFHTVPRHRVVGKPMIWQEYRVHNIAFGLRSVVTAAACSLAVRSGNTPSVRRWAVRISGATCILALIAADIGTRMLRSSHQESTTATTPYWEGCSVSTQKKFKSFYAYCQFLATVGCLMVSNPAIPLAILLPIQIASLLLTLVRKNLLSTRGFHLCYTASLIVPYIVAFRSSICSRSLDFVYLFALGGILYQLRRRGVNKYALWLPVILARVTVGDRYVSYAGW